MDIKLKVLKVLKPRVKSFGFNKRELMSVAAGIADNLDLEDDASEEDVQAAVDTAVDAALPYLRVGQSFANRLLESSKRKNDDEGEDDGERETSSQKEDNAKDSEMKALLSAVKTLTDQVAELKADKTASTRRDRLHAVVKDAGAFGTRAIKNFSRMEFDSDEDFEEWLAEVETDVKEYQQERADAGLSTLANNPEIGKGGKGDKKEEVMSDKELEALADQM